MASGGASIISLMALSAGNKVDQTMAILHPHDGTDEILTSSWTARPTKHGTEIAFTWGASSISWFDSATSVYRVVLRISFADFMQRVRRGGVVDLM
jgi:hypothetical protein